MRIADAGHELEDFYRAYNNPVFALEHTGLFEHAVAVALAGLERIREAGLDHT